MNKTELIKAVATAQGKTQTEVAPIVEEVFVQMAEALRVHEDVSIPALGKFKIREVSAGTALNPAELKKLKDAGVPAEEAKEQATIQVAAHHKVSFKPSQTLKDAVR